MRSFILFAGLLACMQAASANQQVEINFVRQMAERINYAEQNQAAVWPGFHPAATPSLIRFEPDHQLEGATPHAYALNYQPSDLPWQKLETDANGNVIYYLEDASAIPVAVEDGNMSDLDNQKVYMDVESIVDMPRQENFYNKFMNLRGSYFLLNQSRLDLEKLNQTDAHYDMFNKPDLVKLLYLEDAALNKAQQADAALAEEALRDAVAIHQYRLSLMDKHSQGFEEAVEVIQGVPMYISMASRRLNDDDYRKLTQRNSCASLITGYGMDGIAECAQHSYYIYAASVYGRALDKKMSDGAWKTEVETQFKSVSHVMIDYYHMSNAEAKSLTERAMQKPQYNYARLVRTADYIMTPYLAGMNAAIKGYEQQAGIEFSAPEDWDAAFSGSDDADVNDGPYAVDILTTLHTNVEGRYGFGSEAEHYVVFKKVPYVYQRRSMNPHQAGNASDLTFKIEPDTIITIDGVPEAAANLLNAKQQRHFNSITMTAKYVEFKIMNHTGVLDASDGNKLKLSYQLFPDISNQKKRK